MLEKILEEINMMIEKHKNNAFMLAEKEPLTQCYTETDIEQMKVHELAVARDIIRKHMNDGWISCKERLPKRDTKVIVTDINGHVYDNIYYGYASGDDKKMCFHRWDDEYYSCFKPQVIAWQPLPEPYRPEKGEEE